MKNLSLILFLIINFVTLGLNAQDVTYTFANAQNTNDGTNDFYEADVMVESVAGFKLGSGQIYINYNTAAFGENVQASGKLAITHPNGTHILGLQVGSPPFQFPFYKDFITNDNTVSRFSFSWQHAFSEECISNNVVGTASAVFHIKIEYTNVAQSPGICFESTPLFIDQTFTACGSGMASCGNADCFAQPGTQVTNDTYDCTGAALGALPVELVLFTASPLNRSDALLEWQTATELNSGHYEVERSRDAFHWEKLGDVAAAGIRNEISGYDFIDRNAFSANTPDDLVHYRLRMVDLDGSFVYSPIRSVRSGEGRDHALKVYPNPVAEVLFVEMSGREGYTLEIMGVDGKVLRTVENRPFLNVHSMATGVYILRVRSEGSSFSAARKISIVR